MRVSNRSLYSYVFVDRELANTAVDPIHPGDFNQALMELGAIICTPKCPQCKNCPIKTSCGAYAKVRIHKALLFHSTLSVHNCSINHADRDPLVTYLHARCLYKGTITELDEYQYKLL